MRHLPAALLCIIALSSTALAGDVGRSWAGREGDGWDFELTKPESGADGTTVFTYRATSFKDSSTRSGTFEITLRDRHFKAWLKNADGDTIRVYDGTLFEDGSVAHGASWSLGPKGRAPETFSWWATIDRGAVSEPDRFDLNRVSVNELVAVGLSKRNARTIVHGRLMESYGAIDDALSAPGLSGAEKKLLAKRGHIQ